MKKLFTLFALLVCFLSAKAVVVVDAEVNFKDFPDGPSTLSAWGGGDRLSFQGGYLHYHGEEPTANPWDVQFFPISSASLDVDYTYTIEFKIKGTGGPIFNMAFGGVDKYGVYTVPATDEWQVVKVEYQISNASANGGGVLFQCGEYVGDWDMEYMKIYHEEREQKPVEWANIIVNGDAEGEFGEVACVQTKVWNVDEVERAVISPAQIEAVDGNNAFVCHSKAVNPPLLWEEDGEQWGTQHSAGDPKPDNAWQNQMWITFPRPMVTGEQVKIKFRYRASKAVKVDTQSHRLPGDYLGGGPVGQLSFTTAWQTFEKTFSAEGDNDFQSIAFNLGSEIYDEDIDFYLDDVEVSLMVLEEGFFAAAINNNDELAEYDYEHAIKFEADNSLGIDAFVGIIGTPGDQSSWVNEAQIATVRGNDKAYQAATIKIEKMAVNDITAFVSYTTASKAKIKFPALGVWMIMVVPELKMISFAKLEGEEDKEPITITPNPTEVIVNATEKGEGNPWDNQFFIIGNRTLKVGEEVAVEFLYKADKTANIGSQSTKDAGEYLGGAWALFEANQEYQQFKETYTIKNEGQNSFTFNLSEFAEANTYYFKDIVFKLTDDTESLIDMEGTKNLFVKEGAGDTAHEFGTESGIEEIATAAKASNVIYNIAGQRVSNNYKGIVIKNGGKYLVK